MKTPIVDVNEQRVVTTLYKQEKEVMDFQTGEVVASETNKLTKEKKRERFIKVFIDNMEYIIGSLNRLEKEILWVIMQEMNYHNIIKLDSSLRKSIQMAVSIAQGTASKGLTGFIKKKVLLKISEEHSKDYSINHFTDKEYLVNPQLVGQGSFKELSQMRRVVTTSFDFDNFEAVQEVVTSTSYSDMPSLEDLNNHKIKEIRQIVSDDGKHTEREVVIDEKRDITGKQNDVIDIKPREEKSLFDNTDYEEPSARLEPEEITLTNSIDPNDTVTTYIGLKDNEIELALQNSKTKEAEAKRAQAEAEAKRAQAEAEARKAELEIKRLDLEILRIKNVK